MQYHSFCVSRRMEELTFRNGFTMEFKEIFTVFIHVPPVKEYSSLILLSGGIKVNIKVDDFRNGNLCKVTSERTKRRKR